MAHCSSDFFSFTFNLSSSHFASENFASCLKKEEFKIRVLTHELFLGVQFHIVSPYILQITICAENSIQ